MQRKQCSIYFSHPSNKNRFVNSKYLEIAWTLQPCTKDIAPTNGKDLCHLYPMMLYDLSWTWFEKTMAHLMVALLWQAVLLAELELFEKTMAHLMVALLWKAVLLAEHELWCYNVSCMLSFFWSRQQIDKAWLKDWFLLLAHPLKVPGFFSAAPKTLSHLDFFLVKIPWLLFATLVVNEKHALEAFGF